MRALALTARLFLLCSIDAPRPSPQALAQEASTVAALLDRRRTEIRSILVYCVAGEGRKVCGHNSVVRIAYLPEWDWSDISAHLQCTKCGAVGYVDTRPDWPKVPMGVNAR